MSRCEFKPQFKTSFVPDGGLADGVEVLSLLLVLLLSLVGLLESHGICALQAAKSHDQLCITHFSVSVGAYPSRLCLCPATTVLTLASILLNTNVLKSLASTITYNVTDYWSEIQSLSPSKGLSFGSYGEQLNSLEPASHCYGHCCRSRSKSLHSPFNNPPQNVLIIGATGRIGSHITKAVVDARGQFGKISVYVSEMTVVKKHQDICALESCGVEVWVGELDDEKRFKEACRGVGTIVSCVGQSVIEKQSNLVTWAEQCHVKRFFPSEYGTDIEYFPDSIHEPPHQAKLKVRAHMRTMKKLEHTYLVTGPCSDLYFDFMPERPEAGGFDVRQRKACLLGDGSVPVSFTTMNDIGKFVVAALIKPDVSRNSTLVVHSFTASPDEIVAEYQAQTDGKWEVSYTSLDDLRDIEKYSYQNHSPSANTLTLRRIWTEGGTLYKYYDDMLLGDIETETLKDQVHRNIRRQTAILPQEECVLRMISAV